MTPPDALENLPPTCELVYLHLALAEGDLSFADLEARTARPADSIRYALTRLEKQDMIETERDDRDRRKKWYRARSLPDK